MNKKNKRLIILITLSVAALLVIGGFFIVAARHNDTKQASTEQNSTSSSTNTSNAEGLPRQSETTPASNSGSSSTQSNTSPNAPAKPTLNKSSGNNGPIPANVLVNFICSSAAGTSCEVILTSKTDSAKVIRLGSKSVASTYGQSPFASWDWTSISGSWKVVARASNGSGFTDSDIQGLTVQ